MNYKSSKILLIEKEIFLLYLKIAPVPGLEPGTRGLTVHCSNQLSYTGIEDFSL